MGYTAEAATSVEKSERVAASGGVRGDGYTELPNEATAVDFVQPLCRMRQWSCNRLPINNALVSGARARGGRRRSREKKRGRRRAEARSGRGWRRRRGKGRRNVSDVARTSSIGRRAFVLVVDVAGLVHYPCVILIVFTLRLIDARWTEGDYPSPSSSLRWDTMTREESRTSKVSPGA